MIYATQDILQARVHILERVVRDLYLELDNLESSKRSISFHKDSECLMTTPALSERRDEETSSRETPSPDLGDVEAFIQTFIEQHGHPPTYHEIAQQLTYFDPRNKEKNRSKPTLEVI